MHEKVSLLFCFLYFIFFIIFNHSWTILLSHDYCFYFISRFVFCFSIKFMISKHFKLTILENKCKPVYHHLPFHFSLSLLIRGVYRWSSIFDSTFQMFSQYSILRLVYFPPSTCSLFYSLFFLLIHLTRIFFFVFSYSVSIRTCGIYFLMIYLGRAMSTYRLSARRSDDIQPNLIQKRTKRKGIVGSFA